MFLPCAGRAWLSYPLIISRGSEYHGRSHVTPSSPPSFLEAVKFPLNQEKYQAHDILRKEAVQVQGSLS